MNRDPGPTNCCNYACQQGRTCPARIDTDMPKPTDGGDWMFFDKTSEVIFWVGAAVMVIALFSIIASLTIFFFI